MVTELSKISNRLRILTLLLLNPCFAFELKPCKSASYDQLCKLQDDYDETKVPGSLPLTLTPSTTDIIEVNEVDEIKGSITIFLQLVVDWSDENLSYKPNQT